MFVLAEPFTVSVQADRGLGSPNKPYTPATLAHSQQAIGFFWRNPDRAVLLIAAGRSSSWFGRIGASRLDRGVSLCLGASRSLSILGSSVALAHIHPS